MADDLFAQVPEFLAAFKNILDNGFFEQIEFRGIAPRMEGKLCICSISATGCVPNDKKYNAEGYEALIDPNAIIASCRKLAEGNKVKDVTTKVETNDWSLYDEEGKEVIGSKGKRTELSLIINFEIPEN